MSSEANIELEWNDSWARLTLARADKLNPLDWATVRELKAAVAAIEARADIFAVVVTGRGRSFSAGGDLDGYMAGYAHSPDLVFTSGGKIRRGWDETYAKYKAKYGADKSTMGHPAFEILGVQKLGDAGAIVLGRWTLTDTPNSGAGVFSVALEHRAEGWRVVHDHTSVDSAP